MPILFNRFIINEYYYIIMPYIVWVPFSWCSPLVVSPPLFVAFWHLLLFLVNHSFLFWINFYGSCGGGTSKIGLTGLGLWCNVFVLRAPPNRSRTTNGKFEESGCICGIRYLLLLRCQRQGSVLVMWCRTVL